MLFVLPIEEKWGGTILSQGVVRPQKYWLIWLAAIRVHSHHLREKLRLSFFL